MSVRETIRLNKTDLRYLLIDSLKLYSDNVMFIGGNNPYKFVINKKTYYVLIKNVHESGDGRDNSDECRIQISKSANFNEALSSNYEVIVLGYFADERVFTAWNPYLLKERFNQRQTVSVYSRFSIQKQAAISKIAAYINNNNESIISFKPDYLGLYLENLVNIHLLSESELFELISLSDTSNTEDYQGNITLGKEQLTVTHTRYKRDPRFKNKIYQAYNNRCAMCGIQLELIEAAHIVPHVDESSSNDLNNGIALCALHHTAYDKALIYFDENFNILINQTKIQYLEKIGKDSGYRKFKEMSFEVLDLPDNHAARPNIDNIKLANSIRGIS